MKEPLNQFADRILRNNEVRMFIAGLVEKGYDKFELRRIVDEIVDDATKDEEHDIIASNSDPSY